MKTQRETERILKELFEAIEEKLLRLLNRIQTDIDGAVLSNKASIANAGKVRTQLIAEMQRNGVREVSTVLNDAMQKAIDETMDDPAVKKLFRDLPDDFKLEADIKSTLKEIFSGQQENIVASFKEASAEMAKAVRQASVGAWPKDRLIKQVAERLNATFEQASTAIDTATQAVQRATTTAIAEKANEDGVRFVYKYIGASSGIVRPFCEEHLGNFYTKEFLDDEDNGQVGPVSAYLGGYNCRHTLAPKAIDQLTQSELKRVYGLSKKEIRDAIARIESDE